MTMYSEDYIASIVKEGADYYKIKGWTEEQNFPVPYHEKSPQASWWWAGFLAQDELHDARSNEQLDYRASARKIAGSRL